MQLSFFEILFFIFFFQLVSPIPPWRWFTIYIWLKHTRMQTCMVYMWLILCIQTCFGLVWAPRKHVINCYFPLDSSLHSVFVLQLHLLNCLMTCRRSSVSQNQLGINLALLWFLFACVRNGFRSAIYIIRVICGRSESSLLLFFSWELLHVICCSCPWVLIVATESYIREPED
jgi:hypothetical protein